MYMYAYYVSEVGGSETNREIDFGFGSCVRARGGCLVRMCSKLAWWGFPFSLFASPDVSFSLVQVSPSKSKWPVKPSEDK